MKAAKQFFTNVFAFSLLQNYLAYYYNAFNFYFYRKATCIFSKNKNRNPIIKQK